MDNETNNDVNENEVDSSTTSETQVDNQQAEGTTASEQTTKPDQSNGIRDAINKALGTKEAKPEQGEETTEVETQVEGEQDDKGEKVEAKEEKVEDKGPVPYDRFQEVIKEKNEATEKLKGFEPVVQAYNNISGYLQQGGVTPDEFNTWLDIAVLSKTDPAKAMELLQPQLQQLQGVTGDVLPQDLKVAVDAGEITETWAKQLAKARGQGQVTQRQVSQSKEQIARQQQQQYQQQLTSTLENWVSSKQALDPDLKPAKQGEAKGKFELVMNEIQSLWHSGKQVNSPHDLAALAEEALKNVNATLNRFKPKTNGQVHVRSSQAGSGKGAVQIKTTGDAVRAALTKAAPRR